MTRVEARRVLADDYADVRGERAAIDVFVNGESLSMRLDAAPYGPDEIVTLGLTRAWLAEGHDVPLFNCTCGDPGCAGTTVDVTVSGDSVTWSVPGLGRPLRFSRQELHRSLSAALSSRGD
ncbi:MAG TPA: hypothetical protein VGK49_04610 [Ilumatobacteraceae bacterium]